MPEWSSFWQWAGWMCFVLPLACIAVAAIETVASAWAIRGQDRHISKDDMENRECDEK